MNLRVGAFGRQEGASAVAICMFGGSCFAFDSAALFSDGNASYLTYAIALIASLLLFELLCAALNKRGGLDLSSLVGGSVVKRFLTVPLMLSLLLAALLPMQQCLLTVTQYVFVDAKQASVCLYLLPCLTLLCLLGAEPLVRTARILLPVLGISILIALLSNASQMHAYRLFPIPVGKPEKLLHESASALHRTVSPLLALLCIGDGTQRADAQKSAGRIGAAVGAIAVLSMLLGLSCCFSYGLLQDMPSPFYRLLVEARTESPALRLDRAALFLWTACSLLGSAIEVFAAGVLLCRMFGVCDVRPVVCALSALCVSAVLLLYRDSEPAARTLSLLYRYGWIGAVVPLPLLCIGERRKRVCAAS